MEARVALTSYEDWQNLFYQNNSLTDKKIFFLDSLKGKSLAYKRYTKSPLRYGGGKSLAVGLIIEHFPNDIKRLVSPFMGGGSVEIASALELGLEVKRLLMSLIFW